MTTIHADRVDVPVLVSEHPESTEHPTPESSGTGLAALEARLARSEAALQAAQARLDERRPSMLDLALRMLGHRSGRIAALVLTILGPGAVSATGLNLAREVEGLAAQQRELATQQREHDRLLLLFGEAVVLSLEHQQLVSAAQAENRPAPPQGERLSQLRRKLAAIQTSRELALDDLEFANP